MEAPNRPKPFVFVLMPFLPEFNDIYHLGIKQACIDSGAYCERVDEQFFQGTILDRIYNQISKADVIVADMTGRNPNVFYETGYSHALGKNVILLTQKAEDIPFDLKKYPHIIYGGKITELKDKLTIRIKWIIENPQMKLKNSENNLEFYINGALMHEGMDIVHLSYVDSDRHGKQVIPIKIDIYNPNSTRYNGSCELGIVAEKEFTYHSANFYTSHITLPDSRNLFMMNGIGSLLPHSWESRTLYVRPENDYSSNGSPIQLRIYSDLGLKEISFKISYSFYP